ncbi:hypothetical protein ACFXPR_36615 [Nocardia tengchongensis]|uniref:hypothetical protein n=1 Tax=Nocardia tengchongensis TaxID=2055889 RepID=UPI0036828ADF
MVAMVAESSAASSSGGSGGRRSQQIARAARRRRRPNIVGPKTTIEVVFSEEEFAKVAEFAERANCTVPWYVVQAAVDPVAPSSEGKSSGPWLPWPARRELVRSLNSAASAMDMMRLHHVKKIGGNLNRLVHLANIDELVSDEVLDQLPDLINELWAVAEDLRERAEKLEEYAREASRR